MAVVALGAGVLAACAPAGGSVGSSAGAYPTVTHLILPVRVGPQECVQTTAQVGYTQGLGFDAAGNMYVADGAGGDNRVERVTPSGSVTAFAGNGGQRFHRSQEGQLATNVPILPQGNFAFDAGNVYFSESAGHVVRVSSDGRIHNVAGRDDILGFSGDGGLAKNADVNDPSGVLMDPAGNLYIADKLNNRIRRVTADGHIFTIAGTGGRGNDGDGGLATMARIKEPIGLALDPAGNLYFTSSDRVRKISREGMITTVAGNGAMLPQERANDYAGMDGPATEATIPYVDSIAFDTKGNLFVSSSLNRAGLYVVTPDGKIHLVVPATSGTSTSEIYAVATDGRGNMYYASRCGVYRLGWN